MTFEEMLQQTVEILKGRGRVSYQALKRQFEVDDDYLADLKEELLYAYSQVTEDGSRGLSWTDEPNAISTTTLPSLSIENSQPNSPTGVYTPQYLVEKILTSHATLKGERKQVTVLFCDLANSTGLAEALGPESMHTVLNQFFELALGAVHRYEGTINQFLGDGFMALFGAPIAHEDHARRAVLAALELRRDLHLYNAKQEHHARGIELALRMGLNTGQVVVGAIGDNLRMDYTAVGDTTNVAARLEHEAGLNQIVISEATHRLVAGYCMTQPLGAFALKGKTEPVSAWEVVSAQSARTRIDVEVERGLTAFVGRDRDLQMLQDRFAQAQAGHGQVVFVVGEAGIGKSRLLLEFRRQLDTTDATWLEGHTMSFGRAFAFHSVIDLLKRHFQVDEDDPEYTIIEKIEQHVLCLGQELRPVLPYLCYLLGVDPRDTSVRTMDPKQRRSEIFNVLRRWLLQAAEMQPQILVFEDLHWMDQATEAFLTFLNDSIPTSRVLCLFTYRPGYNPSFGERTYQTRMVLPTLSTADTVQMAQAMLATEQLPDALQTLIVQKAEGNPFFVEEMVKSLQEIDAIERVEGRYILTKALEEIVVPDTIQDVLMARIDRLQEAPKKTLQLASVIGREFTYRLLDRLADIRERTEAYVQDLKTIELIYEKSQFPELIYMFKHALTQDVAYYSLLEPRRIELHRLTAWAIEDLYADRLPEQYEMLAYHFAKGEEWAKALDYFLKAAEKAAQAFATRESLALYGQALDVAARLDPTVEPETLMTIHHARSNLCFILSDFERARSESEEVLTLARRMGDRMNEGVALAEMGWASVWGHDFDRALLYARQAIEVATGADTQAIPASAYMTLGIVYSVTARFDQARESIQQALINSRAVGDVFRQSLSLYLSGFLKTWAAEYVEGSHLLAEAVQIVREHNLWWRLLRPLWAYGLTLTGKGDYNEACTIFEEGLVLAERVGDEVVHLRLLNSLGWLYHEIEALDRAFELNQRGVEGSRRRGDPETRAYSLVNLGDIFLAKGDLAMAEESFDEVYHMVKDPAVSEWMKWRYSTHLFASLGELWMSRGNLRKAQGFVDQCLEIAKRTNSRKYLVKGWRLQGEIDLAHRQWDEAEGWLRQALLLAREVGNPPQLWKTYLSMGRVQTAREQSAHAQESYQAARDVIDRIKVGLIDSDLRENFAQSPLIRQVYDLSI